MLPATPDEKRALVITHVASIRKLITVRDEAQAISSAKAKEVGDGFRLATNELGKIYSRKFIEKEILEPLNSMRTDLRANEEERTFVRETFGFPSGPQGDLFARMPNTEQERERWKEDGYQAGLQGMEREAPEKCPTIFVGDWEHRWSDGQKELGEAWVIRDRLKAKGDAPQADVEEDEPDVDDTARKLRKNGFLNPSSEAAA